MDAATTVVGHPPFPAEPGPPPQGASQEDKDKYIQDKAAWDAWKVKYERKLFYYDQYLPKAAGGEHIYSLKQRPYLLPCDTIQINGEDRIVVTSATEAYAQLQYQNSRSRWIATFEFKAKQENKGKSPPMYSSNNSATDAFKCLWSDYSHGQGSGWDPEALKVFDQRRQAIKAFREQEKEHDFPCLREAQVMIRKHHDIPDGQKSHQGKKKGKKAVAPTQVEDVDAGFGDNFVDDKE